MEASDLDAELAPVTGLGQRDMADVEFKVELRVLDPIGMVEIERHPHQPLAKAARAGQSGTDEVEDILEADETARRCRGIVDGDRADVHRCVRRLQIDE